MSWLRVGSSCDAVRCPRAATASSMEGQRSAGSFASMRITARRQLGRALGAQLLDGRYRHVHVRIHHRHHRGAGERQPSREHLVGDHAEGVLVGGAADVVREALLRAHVGRRADHHARGGQSLRLGDLGDAEVGDDAPALVVDEDVAGLDVPVHHAVAMGIADGARRPGPGWPARWGRAARPVSRRMLSSGRPSTCFMTK